jgi:hypothetical protein
VPLRVFGRLFSHPPVSLERIIRRETNLSLALHNVLRSERPRSAFVLRVRDRASLTVLAYPAASKSVRASREAVKALVHSKEALYPSAARVAGFGRFKPGG